MTKPAADPATDPAIDRFRQLVDGIWNRDDASSESTLRTTLLRSFTYGEEPLIGPTRVSGMGPQSLWLEVRDNRAAMPDLKVEVTGGYRDGSAVVVTWRAAGTHTGEVGLGNNPASDGCRLAPSGWVVRADGWTRFELAPDGEKVNLIAQGWSPLSLLQQLALVAGGVEPEALLRLLGTAEPPPAG